MSRDEQAIRSQLAKDLRIKRLKQVREQSKHISVVQDSSYRTKKEEIKDIRTNQAHEAKLKSTVNKVRELENEWKLSLIRTGLAHRNAQIENKRQILDGRQMRREQSRSQQTVKKRFEDALNIQHQPILAQEAKEVQRKEALRIRRDVGAHNREDARELAEYRLTQEILRHEQLHKSSKSKSTPKSVVTIIPTAFQNDLDLTQRKYVKINAKVVRHSPGDVDDQTIVFNRIEALKVDKIEDLRRRVIKEMQSNWRENTRVVHATIKRTEKQKVDNFTRSLTLLDRMDRSPDRWGRIKNTTDVQKAGTSATLEIEEEGIVKQEFENIFFRTHSRHHLDSGPYRDFERSETSQVDSFYGSSKQSGQGMEVSADTSTWRPDSGAHSPVHVHRNNYENVFSSPVAVATSYDDRDEFVSGWTVVAKKDKMVVKALPDAIPPLAELPELLYNKVSTDALDIVNSWTSFSSNNRFQAKSIPLPDPLPAPLFDNITEEDYNYEEEEEEEERYFVRDEAFDEDSLEENVQSNAYDDEGVQSALWYEGRVQTQSAPTHDSYLESNYVVPHETNNRFTLQTAENYDNFIEDMGQEFEFAELNGMISSPDVRPPGSSEDLIIFIIYDCFIIFYYISLYLFYFSIFYFILLYFIIIYCIGLFSLNFFIFLCINNIYFNNQFLPGTLMTANQMWMAPMEITVTKISTTSR